MDERNDDSPSGEGVPNRGGSADINRPTSIGNIPIVDPSADDSGNGDGIAADSPAKRKRGRPAGSGSGKRSSGTTTAKEASVNVEGIEKILLAIHLGVAKIVNMPELELDNEEAKKLSAAALNVARFYNVEVDPKILAWVALFGVLGSLYIPRITAATLRKKLDKNTPVQNSMANVQPMQKQQAIKPFEYPTAHTG